ncbi:ras and EF-hand domain-containing protein [Choloepus didactylus]|uniref:ras and EF-hand domain-containing protein n=1 Tax=Choloepus didactylus TaxID=27675 RepID=UPI00189DDB32|nr:ras and EF-hand domain-containing protein [Choloepus didactylus]
MWTQTENMCKLRPGLANFKNLKPRVSPGPCAESTAQLLEAWEPEPCAPPPRLGGARPRQQSVPRYLARLSTPCPFPNQLDEPDSPRQPAVAGGPGLPAIAAAGAGRGARGAPEPSRSPPPGGMEAHGDREELAPLRWVFTACDANRSGRLEREEFSALCAELRVRPADAEAVFQRLDANRDGAIAFQEFARGFRGTHRRERRRGGEPREAASAAAEAGPDSWDSEEDAATVQGAPWGSASPCRAWQDFQERLGDEAKFIPRSKPWDQATLVQ